MTATSRKTKRASDVHTYAEGSLLRHFIALMLPLICGNILQQFYNTIDTYMIGRFVGADEFAAVGLSASLMNLFLFAIIGFCTGLSVLFAASYGASDMKTFRSYYFLSIIIGMLLIGSVTLLSIPLLPVLLDLLQTPAALLADCLSYLRIIFAGLLISYLYNMYSAMLRAVGKANIALSALFCSVILNTVLDYLFLAKLHFGVSGAALATIVAQSISVLYCILYIRVYFPGLPFDRSVCRFNRRLIKQMLQIGTVTSIHQMSLYLGKIFIQGTVNIAGTTMISAYTATGRIEGFANSFGDSGYAATSILIAHNYATDKRDRIQKSFRISMICLSVLGILSAAIMYLLAEEASQLLLGSASGALPEAVSYLHMIAFFYLFNFTGCAFVGYFDGIQKVKIPFIGALSHMTFRVIMSRFWIPAMGLPGLALATGIGWIGASICWGIVKLYLDTRERYRRNKRASASLANPAAGFELEPVDHY